MGDSYRPSRRPKARGGGPSLASRITFESGGGDSYRPNDAQTHHHQPGGQNRAPPEFTFTPDGSAPRYPPVGPAGDSRSATRKSKRGRDRSGPSQHYLRSSEPTTSQAGGRRNQNRPQRGGRRPWKKQQPHERPLLQSRDDTGSEHILGTTNGTNRFLNPDDLSEDETDMDLDTDEHAEEGLNSDSGPSRKKVRADRNPVSVPAPVPRWSNPDPYTVLPPPDETTGKQRDVVKLIRKAKNQASKKAASSNAVAANDDFISFSFDVDESTDADDDDDDDELPTSTRQRDSDHSVRGSLNEAIPTGPSAMTGLPARPPPPPQASSAKNHKRKYGEGDGVTIVKEWQANTKTHPAPWVQDYAHLRDDMSRW